MITEWPKADRRFLHWVNPPTNPRDIIITVPILQKSQLRDREVTDLIQGHTARCQSWDSNPGSYIPESGLLFHAVLFQVGAGSRKQQRGRMGTENTHSTGGRWAWRQKPPEWARVWTDPARAAGREELGMKSWHKADTVLRVLAETLEVSL